MSTENYKPALDRLKQDLRDSKIRRLEHLRGVDEEEERIAHLRQTVAALSKLCGEAFDEDDDEFGLTDAIRMALKAHGGHLTPQQVKSQIEKLGFKTDKYSNALASIHTVLKRLVIKGELDDNGTSGDGKTAYRWIPEVTRSGLTNFAKLMGVDTEATEVEHPMRKVVSRPSKSFGQKIGDGLLGDGKKK